MLSIKFTPVHDTELENYFISLGMEHVVEASKGKQRGVNDMVQDTPYKPVLKDLHRLHSLVRENRRTTVLEFGTGWSSLIMADALGRNQQEYGDAIKNLRRHNPFEMHSLDDVQRWSQVAKDRVDAAGLSNARFHVSPVTCYEFQGRLTTRYKEIPQISPDFIYLDGPDQFTTQGSINGLSTTHKDFMPMSSDILLFEHFLIPGTIILVDGRAANARFLQANLQRHWSYSFDEDYDQHLFVLDEPALGKYNAAQLAFYAQGGTQ
ncbi:class I SAM-dependent methyltransferase [Thalassospira sp. HF15]|uniref:class I SAM-dependent methyltransferase n=1 Tax=Thalassospira sp. HF15 TaxID=2722755 RepID=UPI0014317427|nr:class I SAM-dependent methyltransferase [Thalassospira sp. HF15]NIY75424.1 class I SAM-dependent methyltransferase [Thalassospira sp. HF15]